MLTRRAKHVAVIYIAHKRLNTPAARPADGRLKFIMPPPAAGKQ